MLARLTIVHPLVDACSLCVLLAGGMTWERVLAYNFLAFALQLPLGVALDAWPGLTRRCFALGCGLVCAAACASAAGAHGWFVLAVACVGNALFHLTAGKQVLDAHGGRSGPIGLFISTGALGLLAGRLAMERWAAFALPLFAVVLAICATAAWRRDGWRGVTDETAAVPRFGILVLAGLFALIAWRSWAGLEATRLSAAAGTAVLLASAAATWGGKAAGGYLAERLGRWPMLAASVCGSVVLAWACAPEAVAAWIVLLFVAQLATGPVLSLVYDNLGRRSGTAFGLNCLGLFAGSF